MLSDLKTERVRWLEMDSFDWCVTEFEGQVFANVTEGADIMLLRLIVEDKCAEIRSAPSMA